MSLCQNVFRKIKLKAHFKTTELFGNFYIKSSTNKQRENTPTIISIKRTDNFNNKEFYKKIPNDPIELNRKKVNNAIRQLKSARLLDETIAAKLEVQEAKTPAFYMLLKILKPENRGRPVISSVNCHTTSISQYVNHHLQPRVIEVKSYVKSSADFIKKINNVGKIPDNSI